MLPQPAGLVGLAQHRQPCGTHLLQVAALAALHPILDLILRVAAAVGLHLVQVALAVGRLILQAAGPMLAAAAGGVQAEAQQLVVQVPAVAEADFTAGLLLATENLAVVAALAARRLEHLVVGLAAALLAVSMVALFCSLLQLSWICLLCQILAAAALGQAVPAAMEGLAAAVAAERAQPELAALAVVAAALAEPVLLAVAMVAAAPAALQPPAAELAARRLPTPAALVQFFFCGLRVINPER